MDFYDYYDDGVIRNEVDTDEEEGYMEYVMSQDQSIKTESWHDVYHNCVLPSTQQTLAYASLVMGGSVFYTLLRLLTERLWPNLVMIPHMISVCCGCLVLFLTVSWDWFLVFIIVLMAYSLALLFNHRYRLSSQQLSTTVAIFLIAMQLACEGGFLREIIIWQNIRGIQMVATMKAISFINDMKWQQINISQNGKNSNNKPTLWAYLGYVFCPTTCVLGPWIPYEWYEHRIHFYSIWQTLRYFYQALMNSLLALVFLDASNCLIPALSGYLIASHWIWSWGRMYFDALTVRCSHYFISYLSQGVLVLGHYNQALRGYGSAPSAKLATPLNNAGIYSSHLFGLKVTQVLEIELPRSLQVVVRNWNLPMHYWLKEYIFRKIQATYGCYFVSLLFTYLVSALLHGFHSKVHLVLLSLAAFTYVESVLRSALARVYNICIVASCNAKKCSYALCTTKWRRQRTNLKSKTSNLGRIWLVYLINGLFGLLTVINLAYLGVMMMNDDEESLVESNNSLSTISKSFWRWHQERYMGHCLHIFMYIFYLLI